MIDIFVLEFSLSLIIAMSKLNAGAYEFVPGKSFGTPPPPPPIDRPEQTEAPPPAPTISLNIGGSKPTPPPPAPVSVAQPQSKPSPIPVAVTPAASKPSTPTPAANKIFSSQKSKTDTNAIVEEVKAVADKAVLEDLYGQGMFLFFQPVQNGRLIWDLS